VWSGTKSVSRSVDSGVKHYSGFSFFTIVESADRLTNPRSSYPLPPQKLTNPSSTPNFTLTSPSTPLCPFSLSSTPLPRLVPTPATAPTPLIPAPDPKPSLACNDLIVRSLKARSSASRRDMVGKATFHMISWRSRLSEVSVVISALWVVR